MLRWIYAAPCYCTVTGTRLGDVQGNVYADNLADTSGALASYDKALALARPLANANPKDKEALRAMAAATEERGETLTALGRVDDALAALRSAAQTYEHLITLPGATPRLLLEASTATQTLGDEYGEDSGMVDSAAALVAYRRSLALDEQALRLDSTYLPARRGLAYMHLHIGNVELDYDAPRALTEFESALQIIDDLPAEERRRLGTMRLTGLLPRKEAAAWMLEWVPASKI